MTETELVKSLSEPFYTDFADEMARRVLDADAVGLLYAAATSAHRELPKPVRHKVLFRGAYVLEKIYFGSPALFMPYADAFCRRDFPECADASARRHFAKMMADLLGRRTPEPAVLDRIAEAAAQWAVEPGMKVAVRIWAIEVLKHCRGRVDWVAEIWGDVMETMSHGATPGIECRMRKSWKPRRN